MSVTQGGRAVRAGGLFVLALGGVAASGETPAAPGGPRAFEFESARPDSAAVTVHPVVLGELAAAGSAFDIERFPLGAGTAVDLRVERFRVTGPGTRFVVGRRGGGDVALDFDID